VGADRKTCSRQVNLRVYECVCVCSSTLREREKRKREGTRRDGGFTKPHAHGHFCCSRISGLDDARSWLGERRARPWAAARAGKGPRPVPSCLNSAQRQPSGPACEHHPRTHIPGHRAAPCAGRARRRTRTAQRPAKVAHPLAPGVSGASAWAPAADAPAPPRPGAPPTHHWNSLCQEPVLVIGVKIEIGGNDGFTSKNHSDS